MRGTPGRGRALAGGVVAGIAGGIVISLVMVTTALATAQDVWPVLKGAGAPVLGDRATAPGFDAIAVVLGVAIHFAVSIAWGVVFAALFFGLSRGTTLVAGAVWGVVVWLVMAFVVLPLIGLGELGRGGPIAVAVLEHVLFGFAVGLGFAPYQRPRVVTVAAPAPPPRGATTAVP